MLLKDTFKKNEYPQFVIDKCIYNFSDYKLTESEKSGLCKGLEFAIPPNKLEYADFMLPFELLPHDVKNTDLSVPLTKAVKSKILDTGFFSIDSFNNNKMRNNFSKEEQKLYTIYVKRNF